MVVLSAGLLLWGTGCDEDEKKKQPDKQDTSSPKRDTAPQGPSQKTIEETETQAVDRAIERASRARIIGSNLQAAQESDEPAAPPPKREASGSLSPSKLRPIFSEHNSAMQSCYERELKKDSNLEGKAVLELTIATDGSVRRAQVTSGTLRSEGVHDCLEQNARQWTFPEPDGGAARVRKPYSFSPEK